MSEKLPRVSNIWVDADPRYFREGTKLQEIPYCFPVHEGGLGDFISWIPALQWIAENCAHVRGHVIVYPFLYDLAQYCFQKYPKWKVGIFPDDWKKIPGNMSIMGFPPPPLKSDLIFTAMSTRLSVPGWAYFTNTTEIPEGWDVYPDLTEVPEHDFDLVSREYVILTPGATAPTRTVPGKYWNPIIDWICAQGMTPVLLGRSHLTPDLPVNYSGGLDESRCLDLRDRTTTLEAASLMRSAYATIGLDNGLLHLAACTGGNVVFGYNITTPESRRPRMRGGRLIEVWLSPEELRCIGCMTNMKLSMPHDFRFCRYAKKDAEEAEALGLPAPLAARCVDMLFANDSFLWTQALELLKTKGET